MKVKKLLLVYIAFLLVLSACGEVSEAVESPTITAIYKPGAHAAANPTPTPTQVEQKYTADNADIQQLIDIIEDSDGMSAEYNESEQRFKITYNIGLELDALAASMALLPEQYDDFIVQMQELAISAYDYFQRFELPDISVSTYICDSSGKPFLTFENDEKQIDIISTLIKNYEKQPHIEENSAIPLYSDDYVNISYSECKLSSSSSYRYSINLIIENKTTVPIIVTVNSFAVDGWNLSDATAYQEISSSSKGYVEIRTDELQNLLPETISGSLQIYDSTDQAWGSRAYDAIFSNIEIG